MAINVPCYIRCRWSAKQYILAGLIGTQVAIAIAVVFSIVLCPAHVYFYVADAKTGPGGVDNKDFFYYFTLVANNTSPHKAVRYGAINFEIWHSTGWVPAEVETRNLSQEQPPQNTTRFPVSAEYWQYNVANRTSPAGSSGCVVVVIAQMQFKFGPAFTRPYIVRVFCFSVDFSNSKSSSALVNCTADMRV